MQKFTSGCGDQAAFSEAVLCEIYTQNLWNLWVPKSHGGLEFSLSEGLNKLQELARLDGSLGWTITLCSGANFFIGNLQPSEANQIFSEPAILGGSGGLFGTAEKVDDHFILNGTWKYATGAPYLTHFTLNAVLVENGEELKDDEGNLRFLSFVIPAHQVQVIHDWNTMGLKATATHSFTVNSVKAFENQSFVYNQIHHPNLIFKIPFTVFADLTLWVNYLGMAEHFVSEAKKVSKSKGNPKLLQVVKNANEKIYSLAQEVEQFLENEDSISEFHILEIHQVASQSVKNMTEGIIEWFPHLGIKACKENHPLNLVFRDFFTATQHHNFSK